MEAMIQGSLATLPLRFDDFKRHCCAFRHTPGSMGTGGTETGCNNNDEVTANRPQRVKM